jgi:hypothetical protein
MPNYIIIACSIIAMLMVLFNYAQRYKGLYEKTYQIHPFTIFIWIFNSSLTAIFLLASENWIFAAQTFFITLLQLVLIIWGSINLHKSKTKSWRIAWTDYVCLVLAICAITIYVLTDSALASVIIIFIGGIIGELPTMRKAFVAPDTDRPKLYLVAGLRYVVLTGTLQKIDWVGLISSLFWGLFELFEMCWVIFCQRRVRRLKGANNGQ